MLLNECSFSQGFCYNRHWGSLAMQPIRSIRLREVRVPGDVRLLDAVINDAGDLLLEGFDCGKSVQEFWGDSDYEWWLYVRQAHKAQVLRELRSERFAGDADYRKWLVTKEIPDDPDSVLLWLVKERFQGDVDFREWLDAKGIPSEFESYV
jgi:hypothetical protein